MSDNDPTVTGFKGVWIGAELWNHPELSWMEKCLVAEVDALTAHDRPCHASNERLAEMMNTTPSTVSNMLSKLQKLGIIQRLGFHRVFAERVVAPAYSADPSRNRRLMDAPSSLHSQVNPSLHSQVNPSLHSQVNAEPRVHSQVIRGFTCGLIEPSPAGDTEVLERKNKKKNTDCASASPSGAEPDFALAAELPAKDLKPSKRKASSLEELKAYVTGKLGLTEDDAFWLWEKWVGTGWKVSGKPMASWKMTASAWERMGIFPSQKKKSFATKF